MPIWHREGTVSINGKNVTGVGTKFVLGDVRPGDAFTIDGTRWAEVESVTNDNQLVLRTAWPNSVSNQAYAIMRMGVVATTNADLAVRLSAMLTRWQGREDELRAWHSGTVDGGPNGDGRYPLTDATGVTVLIKCPARLQADADAHEGKGQNAHALATTTAHGFMSAADKAKVDALKSAATRDVTTSPTDTTSGRVLTVESLGLGNPITLTSSDDLNDIRTQGIYRHTGGNAPANTPIPGAGIVTVFRGAPSGFVVQVWLNRGWPVRNFQRAFNNDTGVWSSWVEFYHTGNTTVDGNGHLLRASPIIRLYQDHIEHTGNFHQPPQFERLDVGFYRITGTLGLRLDDGWYLETPADRNGNKYFNIDWEQNVEPENEGGIVDVPLNVVLTIRTYERIWNPQTGRHENGDPIDINEHQTRFVLLRFNELRQPELIEQPE